MAGRSLLLLMVLILTMATGVAGAREVSEACLEPLEPIPLEGWRFAPGDDPARAAPELEDSGWTPIGIDTTWEKQGFPRLDGFAWYRVHFRWDGALPCRPVGVLLGAIDDADETFFNGVLIGRTGSMPPKPGTASNLRRTYALPAHLLRQGDNVLAVRVYDHADRGGMLGRRAYLGDLQAFSGDLRFIDLLALLSPFFFILEGLYHLLLAFFRQRSRLYAYFAGFSLCMAAIVLHRSQLPVLMHLDLDLVRGVNWLGVFLGPPLLMAFIHRQFGRTMPRWLIVPIAVMLTLAVISSIYPASPVWRAFYFYIGQPLVLLFVVYTLSEVTRAVRERQKDAGWFLAAFVLLGVTVTAEIALNLTGRFIPSVIPAGLTLFLLTIIGLIARRESRYSLELAGTAQALQELNQTLERQVEERTRHLEAARRELEARNETLAEFNALVSHDLKAPMRGLEVITEFLETDYRSRLDDEGKRLLDLIRESTRQMRALLDGLLTLARLGRGDSDQPVELEATIAAVRGLLAGDLLKRNAELRTGENLPVVRGNRTWLVEILSNLVSNGVKYNRSGHPVVVIREAAPGEWDGEAVGADEVCLAVQDNGIGIPEEFHEKIFEPFKRLHSADEFEGSGIGLAIVRKAVQSMGGRIEVRSTPGEGTTFFLILKRSLPVPAESAIPVGG